jgi:hypothetical protein
LPKANQLSARLENDALRWCPLLQDLSLPNRTAGGSCGAAAGEAAKTFCMAASIVLVTVLELCGKVKWV